VKQDIRNAIYFGLLVGIVVILAEFAVRALP
jgi:hypothetical protein